MLQLQLSIHGAAPRQQFICFFFKATVHPCMYLCFFFVVLTNTVMYHCNCYKHGTEYLSDLTDDRINVFGIGFSKIVFDTQSETINY